MNSSLSTSVAPSELLRRQHRWMRAGVPLAVCAAGMLLTLAGVWLAHPSLQTMENWRDLPSLWLAGLAASLAAGVALWIFRRQSLLQGAQRIDERLRSMNRLETATEFAHARDPLAHAQREETAEFLRLTPAVKRLRRFPWLVMAVVVLALAHLATLLVWTRPWVRPVPVAKKAVPPPAPPFASIKWISPKSEIKAAPIEEVPLEAKADSASGLAGLTLEVSVNGELKLSAPVDVAELAKAGPHTIQTSIYLDQLNVQPFDMVSYFLRARRITSRSDLPETVSPVQFVQVKPFRDDVQERTGHPGMPAPDATDLLNAVTSLKVAQLRLIKENFALAHAEIAHDSPEWKQENDRVGGEQGVLEKKAGEILQLMIAKGAPAQIVDLVTQAKPLMAKAAQQIAAGQNQVALPAQGKSLSLLTAIEKYLLKIIGHPQAGGGKAAPPAVKDPFEKQKDVQLKQRAETKAGELELLAHEQARLADDLAKNATASDAPAPGVKPDQNRITGTPSERQTQVSQRVAALLNGQNFEPEVAAHLEKSRDQARASLRQLDAEDPSAAREPAAAAAQELAQAADAMQKAGDQKAQAQLRAAAQDLNQAADQARSAPAKPTAEEARAAAQKAAERAEQIRRELAKAAEEQQETGSKQAAARLAAVANALNDPKLRDSLRKLRDQPLDHGKAEEAARRLDEIADRGEKIPHATVPSQEALLDLLERMDRTRANLQHLALQDQAHLPGGHPGSDHPQPATEPGSSGMLKSPGAQGDANSQQGQKEQAESHAPGQGQQGQGKGQEGKGQGQEGKGQGTKGKGKGQGEGKGEGQGSGEGSGQGKGSTAGPGQAGSDAGAESASTDPGQVQKFTRELLDQLDDEVEDGRNFLPNSTTASAEEAVREAKRESRQQNTPGYLAAIYGKLDQPMDHLIQLLRAEVRQTGRQHQITNQDAQAAPPAYRAAVADYFERLSRDYEAAPATEASPVP